MLLDAHNHLHDGRLAPYRAAFMQELPELDVRGAVVNGTREDDWEAVAALAKKESWIYPSFGLHPWYVPQRTSEWREALLEQVQTNPGCGIGEIGLDRWIENHDLPQQIECFTWQLALAARENLPATIHCLRAWGVLWDIVRGHPVPERGFLLHAYGGPAEMVAGFVARGAYFSFSPSFLSERKAAQREVFRTLPIDRVLVETDAPDLAPPVELNPRPLEDANGKAINHPCNLTVAYAALAELRGCSEAQLSENVANNFRVLFSGAAIGHFP